MTARGFLGGGFLSGFGSFSAISTTGDATIGGTTTTAGLTNTGALVESGIIRPTATTGTINDYAPTDFATARYIFLDMSGGTVLTGLAGGVNGRVITFVNINAVALNLQFAHENAGSAAANRFQTFGSALIIVPGSGRQSVSFVYDGTVSRWVQTNLMSTVVGPAMTFSAAATFSSTLGVTGITTLSGQLTTAAAVRNDATISPTAITGTVSDYTPTGLSLAYAIRQDASAAADLTGILAGSNGRELVLYNISTANTITLKHDVTSTAANRFYLPNSADYAIRPNGSAIIRYDAVSSRWRVNGGAP